MAQKRMFNIKIVDSDAFLDMPLSTQCLYFHLNMRADDDGFIGNPRKIQRLIGASEDDLKLLIAKRFVLTFEDGVIVVKHWRMHNCISQNRYCETVYKDEKKQLLLKPNNAYSFNSGFPINDSKAIEQSKRQTDKTIRRDIDVQKTDSGLGLDLGLGLDIDLDLDKELEKENKQKKKSEIKTMPQLFAELLPNYEISEPMADKIQDWIKYKSERHESYKAQGMKSLLSQISKKISESGEAKVMNLIDECMASNWVGIAWDRLNNKNQNGSTYMNAIKNRVDEVDGWV